MISGLLVLAMCCLAFGVFAALVVSALREREWMLAAFAAILLLGFVGLVASQLGY